MLSHSHASTYTSLLIFYFIIKLVKFVAIVVATVVTVVTMTMRIPRVLQSLILK